MDRAAIARETVRICEAGQYQTPTAKQVVLGDEITQAVKGTVVYSSQNLPVAPPSAPRAETQIEVANETTFRGLARLAAGGGHIGCLNFASARNPGGGFLAGAQAQEEALARA